MIVCIATRIFSTISLVLHDIKPSLVAIDDPDIGVGFSKISILVIEDYQMLRGCEVVNPCFLQYYSYLRAIKPSLVAVEDS